MASNDWVKTKKIRLKNWDYTTGGYYYITICIDKMKCVFGEINEEKMILSEMGSIVQDEWDNIVKHRDSVVLDEFVIMPNHIHGIIQMRSAAVASYGSTDSISPKPNSLGAVIRSYKSAVTKKCREQGFNSFKWQDRYYEHIVRNEVELERIRTYISNNVLKWQIDKYYRSCYGRFKT